MARLQIFAMLAVGASSVHTPSQGAAVDTPDQPCERSFAPALDSLVGTPEAQRIHFDDASPSPSHHEGNQRYSSEEESMRGFYEDSGSSSVGNDGLF